MAPRTYKLGQRQVAADEKRRRIVLAARDLLAHEEDTASFTVEMVARRAGVARMTVYHQFQSKRGLLEALFDELANRGLVPHLKPIFQAPSPERALDALIHAFAMFWESDRIVLRRARALAALDPEFAESIRARDERRREHLRNILASRPGAAASIDVLHMLTSFETYDALLHGGRTFDDATRIIRRLAAAALAPTSADP
jgi:AcrR family transcriptional regulator